MNLAWDGQCLVVAGYHVYAASSPDLKPQGLFGFDLHGYAAVPQNPWWHCAYEADDGRGSAAPPRP